MPINWYDLVLAPINEAFAESAWYMPVVGDPYSLRVIFDEGNKDLSLLGTTDINTSCPIASAPVSQFRNPPRQGDRIRIDSKMVVYRVRDPDPDGKGDVKLKLNQVD